MRPQARFDNAQALTVGELRERHAQELAAAREMLDVSIAPVLHHQALEALPRQQLHELREHELPHAHDRPRGSPNPQIRPSRSSNRGHHQPVASRIRINDLRRGVATLTGHYWDGALTRTRIRGQGHKLFTRTPTRFATLTPTSVRY